MSSKGIWLLQALNDKNDAIIARCTRDKSVAQWINSNVSLEHISNSRYEFEDEYDAVTPLTYACRLSDARTVRCIVAGGADVTAVASLGRTPLHNACQSQIEAQDKVTFLLNHDTSLNTVTAHDNHNATPLHLAAGVGSTSLISMLVQNGAKVNERGGDKGATALHIACEEGYLPTMHELIKFGADVQARNSARQETPLHLAARANRNSCVKALIESHNAPINAKDADGKTALHVAARTGNDDVLKTLTSYQKCEINGKCMTGKTALHYASEKGHVACVHELMRRSADVEARDGDDFRPLHLAACFNHKACLKALLENYRASINAKSQEGHTPLHRAAYAGNAEAVKLLTSQSSCDLLAKDTRGKSAADLAREENHQGIASYLMKLTAAKDEQQATPQQSTKQDLFLGMLASLAASNLTGNQQKTYGR